MRAPITPLVPPYHPQAAPLSGYGDIKIGTFVCIYWFYTEVVLSDGIAGLELEQHNGRR